MKQLGQRLAVLEKALAHQAPSLQGTSVQELGKPLAAGIADAYSVEALFHGMSDEQAEQIYAAIA